jgi:hypothetical protein
VIQPWVQLILTDIDLAAPAVLDVRLQFFEMVDPEVRDADCFCLARFLGFDKGVPGA